MHALQPLDVNYFKTAFENKRNSNMIRFNYYKRDKTTFVGWVDKALEISLSKYNIKNEFKLQEFGF
jgi:hypothetical protein